MRKKRHVASEIVARASAALPSFTDIFDEETFYISFACLVVLSFTVAFLLAWYFDIQIKDADATGDKKRRRKIK